LVDLTFSESALRSICSAVKENTNLHSLELIPSVAGFRSKSPISEDNFLTLLQSSSLKCLKTVVDSLQYDEVKKQDAAISLKESKIQVLDLEVSACSGAFQYCLLNQLKGRIETLRLSCGLTVSLLAAEIANSMLQFECLEEIKITKGIVNSFCCELENSIRCSFG
jgi:hypothetical protein